MSIQNLETEPSSSQLINDSHRDKRPKLDSSSQDEENFSCIICSETWTSKGEHCLVSLKCGHLFGKKCVTRWIVDKTRKYGAKKAGCPVCSKISSKSDIRHIKPARFAVKDTTYMDLLKKELDSLKYSIKDQEKTLELSRLSLNLHKRQLEKKKLELSQMKREISSTLLNNLSVSNTQCPNNISNTASQSNTSYITNQNYISNTPSQSNHITRNSQNSSIVNSSQNHSIASNSQTPNASNNGQSNAINLYSINDSQNHISDGDNINSNSTAISSNHVIPNIPNRYSISKSKKLSDNRHVCRVMALDPASNTAYISFKQSNQHGIITLNMLDMSQSPIIPIHDSLVRDIKYSGGYLLSTSMDKTLKLTATATQESGISIPLTAPGWSCCFNESNTNEIYCGLADSSIVVYDIRNTRTYESLLCSPDALSKTPIHSMFVKPNHVGRLRVYCSNLMETFIWDNNQALKIVDRMDGYKPYSLSYSTGNTFLLSSRNESSTKHQFISIDDSLNSTILSTLTSPMAQKSLTKTFALGHANVQDSVICYSQEEPGTLCLSKLNQELQHFRIGSCPLDIQPCNGYLSFLTDNRFFLLSPT